MVVAAAGYLVYTFRLVFRVDPLRVRIAGRFGFGLFHALLTFILIPSAAWMPMTLRYIEQPSPLLAVVVVAGLWATGLASLAMIGALASMTPREPAGLARASVAGAVAFAGQTFLLDSCVWPLLFPW